MNEFTKAARSESPKVLKSDQLLDTIRESSRDHMATLTDESMCVTLAQAWPAIQQALDQIQRDMSRPVASDEANTNLNGIFVAMSQVNSRLLKFIDQGRDIIKERNRK